MLTNTLFRSLISQYNTNKTININTFDDFLNNLNFNDEYHDHNVNKIKGTIFEYITKYYYLSKDLEVYMFNEIPDDVRTTFNLGNIDKGIDLLFKENDEWIPIQCKWRKVTNLAINKNLLLGFIEEAKVFDKKVVVTNVNNPTKYIQDRYELEWILRTNFEQIINKPFIDYIMNATQIKPIIQEEKPKFALRECQINALNALQSSELTRKQCIMFCGTGKSIVMVEYIKLKNVNRVVVLMPNLQLVSQFYNNLKEHVKRDILCICSQLDTSSVTGDDKVDKKHGELLLNEYLTLESKNMLYTTKPTIIAQQLKKENLIVLCTYQSSQLLKGHNFDLGFFDEAHRTVNNGPFGFALFDENCMIKERVFFTATPKYYKGPNDECISMNKEEIYGREVFNYPFSKAKDDKYVLDFQILTYIVPENMENIVNEKYIKSDGINVKKEILMSALMLAQHINSNHGSKKILTYHNTIENAVEYKKTLAYVFLKFNINAKIFTMCGNTKISKRKEIFNEYENSELAIICSSKVLNEGIDLASTNAVMFVDSRSSTIDVTQCFGRADRVYRDQKVCNVIIPIHYNELDKKHCYSEIIKILSALGDIDKELIPCFINGEHSNKIKVIKMNSDCMNDIEGNAIYNFNEVMRGLKISIANSIILGFQYKKALLFKYCTKFKCVPTNKFVYEEFSIGTWFQNQKARLSNTTDKTYIELSKNEYVKANLDEYFRNVENNKDKTKLTWNQWKELLFTYCDNYECVPPYRLKYEDQNIGMWLQHQKKKINSIDDEVYKKLSLNKYLKSNLDEYLTKVENNKGTEKVEWEEWKKLLFTYCDNNKCVPPCRIIYENKRIGRWFKGQKDKLNNADEELYIKLSSNEYVKADLDKYLIYVETNKDKIKLSWDQWKTLLFEYCDKYECQSQQKTKYAGQNIGLWLDHQKKKINNIDDELYKKLSINKYVKENLDEYIKNYDKNKDKIKLSWDQWKALVFKYCDENKCVPSKDTKYENQNIGMWLCDQKRKINNIDDEVYKKLSLNGYVKTSLNTYIKNIDTNKNKVKLSWDQWKILVFSYCEENKCIPPPRITYENKNIGTWLFNQKVKIKSTDDELYKKLSLNEYIKSYLDTYLNNKQTK
jgi:superfamily II DNA or RNA helicase